MWSPRLSVSAAAKEEVAQELCEACGQGHVDVVRLLLDAGAETNVTRTPHAGVLVFSWF